MVMAAPSSTPPISSMVASPAALEPHLTTTASPVGVTPYLISTPVAEGEGGRRTTVAPAIEPQGPSNCRSGGGQLGSALKAVGFRWISGVFRGFGRGDGLESDRSEEGSNGSIHPP